MNAAQEPRTDDLDDDLEPTSLVGRFRRWFMEDAIWWFSSMMFHMVVVLVLAIVGTSVEPTTVGEAPAFEAAELEQEMPEPNLERFEVGETPDMPSELSTETLTLEETPPALESVEVPEGDGGSGVGAEFAGTGVGEGGGMAMAATGPLLGGLGGFDVRAIGPGPAVRGPGGVGAGVGTGNRPGTGGAGVGFGGRGTGARRAMVGSFGGTRQSERAVAAALNWLARHQMADGSWSLDGFQVCCQEGTCSGPGSHKANSAGTAFGLLPFLAAGQTQETQGPYQRTIYNGLRWMIANQKPDGDLRCGSNMYAHGLATIALCEAYGMTGDSYVRQAAQAACNFIITAQNKETGGWRYVPNSDGDTSVVGWQLMALKSGHMAGLTIDNGAFDRTRKWLTLVGGSSSSQAGFSYTPDQPSTAPMTAVGLLCSQYLGAHRDDPKMVSGSAYLMQHPPGTGGRNLYYWYYATQVMHNLAGPDWDTWNRKMRRVLIDSQDKEGCAAGSWDPAKPGNDAWGDQGGRVMMTSLAALTLEVYYRYLPLYKLDKEEDADRLLAAAATDKAEPAPSEPARTEPVKADSERTAEPPKLDLEEPDDEPPAKKDAAKKRSPQT